MSILVKHLSTLKVAGHTDSLSTVDDLFTCRKNGSEYFSNFDFWKYLKSLSIALCIHNS